RIVAVGTCARAGVAMSIAAIIAATAAADTLITAPFGQATTGAANVGAATSMAAPRRRGCSSAETMTMSVDAAAGERARSRRALRTLLSIKSQAVVISPPMKMQS